MRNSIGKQLPNWRERVSPTIDGILDDGLIEQLRRERGVAIVEMAGRDSVAAPLAFCAANADVTAILPTVGYTGTEFGDFGVVDRNIAYIKKRLCESEREVKIFDPVFLGSPQFFRAIAVRPTAVMTHEYGIYTPCTGCHLYLHALRIPLARAVGARWIVSGERDSHDGKDKPNQLPIVLDRFAEFVSDYGIKLAQPIRHIVSGAEIAKIVGEEWISVGKQVECALSGNYRDMSGNVAYASGDIERFVTGYLSDYAFPATSQILDTCIDGKSPAYEEIALNQLKRLNE